MGLKVKKGDKKLSGKEIRRNINYFSWVVSFFVLAIGVFFAWKFIKIDNDTFTFFSIFFSVLFAFILKDIVFYIGLKNARKKHKEFLRDSVVIHLNKKKILTISGLTAATFIILFILFVLIIVPNIDVVEANQMVLGAHRGNSIDYIENTLPAFEDAINNDKYKFIEFDVLYTKDKKIVVHHDKSLKRLQDKNYKIEKLTYEELLNISDYHIPLYGEVMDLINDKKPINLEIKSQGNLSDDMEIVDFVMDDLGKRNLLKTTLFSSVSSDVVKYISDTYSDSEVGKIYYVTSSSFLNLDKFISDVYEGSDEIGADYLMFYASNVKQYNHLKKIKPEDKTLVFWYFTDEMYVIDPGKKTWEINLLEERVMMSPEIPCVWWCDE